MIREWKLVFRAVPLTAGAFLLRERRAPIGANEGCEAPMEIGSGEDRGAARRQATKRQADVLRYVGANILLFSQTICHFASICTPTAALLSSPSRIAHDAAENTPPKRAISAQRSALLPTLREGAFKSPQHRRKTRGV